VLADATFHTAQGRADQGQADMALPLRRLAARPAILPAPFRAYLLSCLLSALGRSGYLLAAAWSLAKGSHGAGGVAMFLLITSLAELAASPLAGWLADHIDRRKLVQAAETARAGVILATGLTLWSLEAQFPLLVSAIFFAAADRASLTAYQALLPGLTGSLPLLRANALACLAVQAGNLAAAALCGLLLTLCSEGTVFVIMAVLPLMAVRILSRGEKSLVGQPEQENEARRAFTPARAHLLRLGAGYALFYGSGVLVSVMGAPYVLHDLKGSAAGFGAIEACWAAGAILGSLLPMLAFSEPRQTLVHFALLQMIALASTCLLVVTPPLHLIVFALIGAAHNAGRVGIEAGLQRHCPTLMQGRVKGLFHAAAMVLAIVIFLICAGLDKDAPAAPVFAGYGLAVMSVSAGLHVYFRIRDAAGPDARD
jgi:MFS family permease